jgi:hypothetical protein
MSQQINLFNPVFLAQKKYFSAAAMLQALGMVLGGMLLINAFAVRQASLMEDALVHAARDTALRRDQLVTLGKQYSDQGTSKKLEEDIARVDEQLRKRRELLVDMTTNVGGNVRGFSAYLTALARQKIQGVWLTGIEISDKSNDLVIRGKALNSDLVPAYVRALSRESAFAGRSLSALQVTAKEETVPVAPAPGAAAAPQLVPQLLRYVEFTLNIPVGESSAASPTGLQSGVS